MFDSAPEFANAAKPFATHSAGWAGATAMEAYDACTGGDLSCVAEAEAMIEKISASVETSRSVWEAVVCGAYPLVPDYLAGHPMNMRRRTHVTNENAPLRIYFDLTSSAAVHESTLAKRGIAFLALAMLLTRSRPVEMHVFTALGPSSFRGEGADGIVTIKLPTAPLDLAIAGGIFTKGIARALGYDYLNAECGTGSGWLKGIVPSYPESLDKYVETVRRALRLGSEDMIIGPVFTTDESIKNPIGFVQKMIDLHSKGEDE